MSILCSNNQSNPKGAAYASSGNSFRGGVSSRFTRHLKGQSTVEYVLIIAIIVLVVLIAGPLVSSAIRNQFDTVAGAIGSGTTGENFYEPEDIPDPQNGTAFAVYSEDDHSLMFYKRRGVPKVGDMFNYRGVTQVYLGIETDAYDLAGDRWYDAVTTPWYGRRDDILSVSVIDGGIAPKSLSYYFQNLENVTSIDISKFSAPAKQGLFHTFSGCTKLTDVALGPQSPWSLDSAFTNCRALSSVDLRPLDLGSVQVCCYLFAGCSSLKTIEGVADIGRNNPYRIEEAFLGCSSLKSLDLSEWNTSYAVADNGHVVRLFEGCTNLCSIEIGANWTWNSSGYGLLPTQSFDGADGKWYSVTTGKGYAPADIPSVKADTYVASRNMLGK